MRHFVFSVGLVLATSSLVAQDKTKQPADSSKVDQLFSAISSGDITTVEKLIDQGADINAKQDLLTPYMRAVHSGFLPIAKLLKEEGADTTIKAPPIRDAIGLLLADSVSDTTPGYAFLVSKDGKVIAEECFGMANVEKKTAIKPEMQFLIGSVSKQFTAVAILKLQESGKLSVDDKLSKYIKDFHRGDEISLHHLLTHTSGITNYTNGAAFRLTQEIETTEEDLIQSFKYSKLEFEPGEKFEYCNSGYFLLGHIVGKVSGLSLGEYLKKEIFDPLGMKNTGVQNDRWDKPGQAMGHRVVDGRSTVTKTWHMSRAGGAGAMYSNLRDLMTWNESLFGGKVLTEASLKSAFAPVSLGNGSTSNYGYGFFAGTHRGLKNINHSGGLDGFASYLIRYPEQKTTIVALRNASHSGDMPSHVQISLKLAEYVLHPEMETRKVHVVNKSVDPDKFKDYVGSYDYGSPVIMQITLDNGQVYAQLAGQPKYPIYPLDESTFFWKVVDAEVTFERDKDGKVVAAVHRQGGTESRNLKTDDNQFVSLSIQELEKYAGFYDYGGAIMEVTLTKNALLAQLTGQPKLRILPTAKHTFKWAVVDAKIEFIVDENGKVSGGKHTQGGKTLNVAKIDLQAEVEAPAGTLKQYVGAYNYGLLAGKMQVTLEDGKLLAQLRGQPKLVLVATGKDSFRWKDVNASIVFYRDKDGKITHAIHKQRGQESKVPKVE